MCVLHKHFAFFVDWFCFDKCCVIHKFGKCVFFPQVLVINTSHKKQECQHWSQENVTSPSSKSFLPPSVEAPYYTIFTFPVSDLELFPSEVHKIKVAIFRARWNIAVVISPPTICHSAAHYNEIHMRLWKIVMQDCNQSSKSLRTIVLMNRCRMDEF